MKVHTGEINNHSKGYSIGNHSHKYYEIVYYISGNGIITINKKDFFYSPNTFSVSKPNSIHSEKSTESASLIYVGFSVDDTIDTTGLENGVYKCDKSNYILSTLKEIVFELQSKNFFYYDQLELLTKSLINQLKRSITKTAEKDNDFQKAKEYIKQNCMNGINAIQLAKHFNYNYDYFRKEFKRYYSISISEMILQEQVNYATSLLRETSLKISEIAEKSGFSSTSHFISCFKKQHKVTPKKYIIKDIKC